MTEDDTFTALTRPSYVEVANMMVNSGCISTRRQIHRIVISQKLQFPDVDFKDWSMSQIMSNILNECNWTQSDFLKAAENDRG